MLIKIAVCKAKWKYQGKNFFCIICLFFLLLPYGCLKQISYEREQLEAFFKRKANIQLTFETDKGTQVAFYVPPSLKPNGIPEKNSDSLSGNQCSCLRLVSVYQAGR